MDQHHATICHFEVVKADYIGKRPCLNFFDGTEGAVGDVWNVELGPVMPKSADDPNMRFFEATPSGQFQLWSVMNFAPPLGTIVEIRLTVPEGVPLQQEPPTVN